MSNATSGEEFWRLSALFLKVVDGRFAVWGRQTPRTGTAIHDFGSSIQEAMKNRVSAWKAKREKTLLGEKAPAEIFIVES